MAVILSCCSHARVRHDAAGYSRVAAMEMHLMLQLDPLDSLVGTCPRERQVIPPAVLERWRSRGSIADPGFGSDGWGRPFQYYCDADGTHRVISAGADGVFGTNDDIIE
jgi:hypothetical protein